MRIPRPILRKRRKIVRGIMSYKRFLLTFILYPRAWIFGITFADYDELDAYAVGLGIGAGAIVLGVKK